VGWLEHWRQLAADRDSEASGVVVAIHCTVLVMFDDESVSIDFIGQRTHPTRCDGYTPQA
jgi:hypothetical protein